MMSMIYLVPSRGRPHNAVKLIESWEATRTFAHLCIALDADDPTLTKYPATGLPPWVHVYVGPRKRLGPTLNHLAIGRCSEYATVGFMGDDHRPETAAWDAKLLSALTGSDGRPSGIAYGNDLIQGANLPTAVLMSCDIVNALGYMVPPTLVHLFLDNFWRDLGVATRTLTYVRDVVIEHAHPIAGRAEWDEGYRENNSGETWNRDEAAYKQYHEGGEFTAAVARVMQRTS
jgi:hypothetical protein